MAIFETGSVTSVPNLLNNLVAFCVANGWTSNANAIEASGRRAHLKLGSDVYINLRALVNEYAQGSSTFGGLVSGLAINGSTNYDSGQAWYNQPGAPNSGGGTVVYRMAGIMGVAGAIPAYYFHARANMIYVWIEYSTGNYQFMAFGKIEKDGAWNGGTIFFASAEGHSNSNAGIGSTLVGSLPSGASDLVGNPNGYLYGTFYGSTGWSPASNTNPTSPDMPRFFCTLCIQSVMASNAPNTFNGLPVPLPIDVAVASDGAGNITDFTNFGVEGWLPDIHFCNIRYLTPAQQLDDGSGEVFRIYPFRAKAANSNNGGWFGVAIKEN